MLKFEMHLHPHGGSRCADGDNRLTVEKYLKEGYEGIVTSTHLSENYYSGYPGDTHREKLDYFFKCHDDFANIAEAAGIKTYFASEIRLKPTNTEYMLIGFGRSFFYENPPLFLLSQEELFGLAEKNGFFMYQTHPFRDGVTAGNPLLMHGAEGKNGHVNHNNHGDLAECFCLENNLASLGGTDYHHDTQPVTAGVYFNGEINSVSDIVRALKAREFTAFCK